MKLKKVLVGLLSAAIIATTVPSVGLSSIGMGVANQSEVEAASAVITQIPGTTRSFSSYSDSFMNVTGFASDGISDRSSYVGTSYHVKVSTELDFLKALKNAQSGKVKIIEITSDLDMGYNELGLSSSDATTYGISKYANPTNGFTNPTIEASGVSKLNISNTKGLTIFSTNGASIRHVELKLQNSTSDLAIRNLNFEGLYQFDDAGNHKEVGWTFIKVNGANDVWIDHCSFAIAADGMLDIENGSSGVTLSWCKFGLESNSSPSSSSDIYTSVNYMESKYNSGSLASTSRYYKMRKAGASKSQIMAYEAYHSKTHLVGSGDKDYCNYVYSNGTEVLDGNQRLELSMAYNYYLNQGQRQPMIRQGKGHLYNCYFDNSGHTSLISSSSALASNGCYSLSRGINARNGASIGADTCVYNQVAQPLIGAEVQGDDAANMNSPWDTLFGAAINHSLIVNSKYIGSDGSTYTGSSWDNNGSNKFTSGFTWNDKSSIGNWAWSSTINGVENMSKSNPPSTPFTFTYNYNETLPYSYQLLKLDDVQTVIPQKAGCGKISMDASGWTKTNYGTATVTSPSPSATSSTSTVIGAVIEEGTYMIKNVNSGLYLDVEGGVAANGVNVQQWGASGSANYNTWKIVKYTDTYYKIYSMLGGGSTYLLDVKGKSTDNGANVQIYTDNSGDNQLFQFVKNSDGSYGIVSKISGSTKGLDVAGCSTSSGANIQQYSYGATSNQKFVLEKVSTATTSPSPSPSPSASSSPSTSSVIDLLGTSTSWSGGYNMDLTIKNVASTDITDWTLYLNTSEAAVNNIWCAYFTTSGSQVVITPESWNAYISAGGTINFGFTATGSVPTSLNYTFVYTMNGTQYSCSGTDSL